MKSLCKLIRKDISWEPSLNLPPGLNAPFQIDKLFVIRGGSMFTCGMILKKSEGFNNFI